MKTDPKGPEAARLRQLKFDLARQLRVPVDALPGSLSLVHTHCGKDSCHCADGDGHTVWSLTYMDEGKKQVERIPEEWVEDVRKRVDAGKSFKEAVARVFVANAKLLSIEKKQQREQRRRKKKD